MKWLDRKKDLIVLIACALALIATEVYASCTTSVIIVDGKTLICMTCCSGSNCTTTCN